MKKILKYTSVVVMVLFIAALSYVGKGYYDAKSLSAELETRANLIISEGRGGEPLGANRLRQLLVVQDPAFRSHSGIDLTSPGAGLTTISQSVSKRLAFEKFTPGIGKIRQTGFAVGLEDELSKDQILALWLETLEMGKGPDGWMTGFYSASQAVYGKQPSALPDDEYFRLLAVLIAPGKYNLLADDADLTERARRIAKLVASQCNALGNSDVWLEGCK